MCVPIGHIYKIGLLRFLSIKMPLIVTVLHVVFFYPRNLTKMQTVQTRIRMVTHEASDPGLECLPKHPPIIRNGLFILYTYAYTQLASYKTLSQCMSKWTSPHTGYPLKHVNTVNGARHQAPHFELNEV